MNFRKVSYTLGINLLILCGILMALEGITRLITSGNDSKAIFDDPTLRTRNRQGFVETDRDRGFALKPNSSQDLYNINASGFRGEPLPQNLEDKLTILTLGESTTFGWGVRDNETYPAYLNQALQTRQPNTYVINGGVPSYTSSQVLAYLDQLLDEDNLQPDLILISIAWNDIWYSSIQNWHPDILIYQKPPAVLTFLMRHSRLVNGIILGFSAQEQSLVDIENPAALKQYRQNLQAMVNRCQGKGIKVIFIEPPFDGDHMPEEGLNEFHIRYTKAFFIEQSRKYLATLRSVAEETNVPVINHRLGLQDLNQFPLFLDTLHPTPAGNAMMAEDIANAIPETHWPPKLSNPQQP